jgi:hypothetical protein
MKNILVPLWLMLGLLFVSSCNLNTPVPPDQLPTDTMAEPTEVTAIPIFGPGTFSLDLPEGWDVAGPNVVTTEDGRAYDSYSLGEDPTSSGGPGTSHVIIGDAAEWTPEELVLMQCSTCPDNGFEQVVVGGKPGQRTQVGGGGVPMMITWTYVENKGKLIGIAIHDPQTLEPLTAVIDSIIFN